MHEIITSCMKQGSSGSNNQVAPCTEVERCTKIIPEDYRTKTFLSVDGYHKNFKTSILQLFCKKHAAKQIPCSLQHQSAHEI